MTDAADTVSRHEQDASVDADYLPERVWDPIQGSVHYRRRQFEAPKSHIELPVWTSTLGFVVMLFGFLSFMFTESDQELPLLGIGIVLTGAVLIFAPGVLGKRNAFRLALYSDLARHNGWGFDLMAGKLEEAERVARETGLPFERNDEEWTDPRITALKARVPELMRGTRMVMIEALYWGHLTLDDQSELPFWMGLMVMDSNSTFGTAETKKDKAGRKSAYGQYARMCLAYDLARDTGLRASLTASSPGSDRIETEWDEFNDAFHIASSDGGGAALLRTLTPALQTTLLDLQKRFDAQLVIDDRTLWMSGSDSIASRDRAVVAEAMRELVEEFAAAAISLKRYAE